MHSKESSWWCCVSKCPRRLHGEACEDTGGYRCMQYDDDRLNNKLQNSPLTQTRPELVFAHGAEAKRKKKWWVLFTLWTHLCVCQPFQLACAIFMQKKAQNQTHPVIQTVFKISSGGKEKKYFVNHLWIVKLFNFQPRHISIFYLLTYLFYIKCNNAIHHHHLFSPYMADPQRVILYFLNVFISSCCYPVLKIINIAPSWIDYGSHIYTSWENWANSFFGVESQIKF